MTSPSVHQIMTPLFRITLFEGILTWSDRHTHGFEASFQLVDLDGFPSLEGDGVICLIITIRKIHQIMGPDITALGVIIELGDLVKMPAVVSPQGIIETQHTSRLQLCTRKTGQQIESCMVYCVHSKRTLG